jgi:hypothetical protein
MAGIPIGAAYDVFLNTKTVGFPERLHKLQ